MPQHEYLKKGGGHSTTATRWKETYNVSTNAFTAYLCEQYEQLLSQLAHEAGETSNTTELAELATYLKKGGGHA